MGSAKTYSMRTLNWLRALLADLFGTERDEAGAIAEQAEHQVAAAKAAAALAVAQAQRCELALRDALEAGATDPGSLGPLVADLEEVRERARGQIALYREQQQAAARLLERMGELNRLNSINRQRETLRQVVVTTPDTTDPEAVVDRELAARAEAVRLDGLDALERRGGAAAIAGETPRPHDDVMARARELLAGDTGTRLWPGE